MKKAPRGDKLINRVAASGPVVYRFAGKKYLLEPGKLYGTRLDRKTGERRIVELIA